LAARETAGGASTIADIVEGYDHTRDTPSESEESFVRWRVALPYPTRKTRSPARAEYLGRKLAEHLKHAHVTDAEDENGFEDAEDKADLEDELLARKKCFNNFQRVCSNT
jgi:hypothetical protein